MRIEDFLDKAEEDSKTDEVNLDIESINLTYTEYEYIKLNSSYKVKLNECKNKYNVLKKWKRDYYLGLQPKEVYDEAPFDLKIRKNDVNIYIEADPELQSIQKKIFYYEEMCSLSDKMIKILDNKKWNIKNAIADRVYKQGL